MSDVLNVRYSEVKRFKRCRRSWYNGYYLNLALPEFEGEVAPKLKRDAGTLVHRDLEAFYKGETDNPGDFLRGEAPPSGGQFDKEWTEVYNLAQIMLDGYGEWLEDEGWDSGEETMAVEKEVITPFRLPNGNVNLVCHIDRIVMDTSYIVNRYIIEDTKTVDSLEKGGQFAVEEQLLTYALVANRTLGLTISECRHNMLRRVKRTARATPPFYGRKSIEPSSEQLNSVRLQLEGVLNDLLGVRQRLDAGEELSAVCYPNATRDCSWDCDFLPICPSYDEPLSVDLPSLREAIYIPRPTNKKETQDA